MEGRKETTEGARGHRDVKCKCARQDDDGIAVSCLSRLEGEGMWGGGIGDAEMMRVRGGGMEMDTGMLHGHGVRGNGIMAFEYSRWATAITGHVSVLRASSGHSVTGEEQEEKE